MSQEQTEAKLRELMKQEEFVTRLTEAETEEEITALLKEENLSVEEVEKLISKEELNEEELEMVSGGLNFSQYKVFVDPRLLLLRWALYVAAKRNHR